MNELISINSNSHFIDDDYKRVRQIMISDKSRMTSLELAAFVGTRHSNMLRTVDSMIDGLLSNKRIINQPELTSYIDSRGKERRMYLLDKRVSRIIACKFDLDTSVDLIVKLEELELLFDVKNGRIEPDKIALERVAIGRSAFLLDMDYVSVEEFAAHKNMEVSTVKKMIDRNKLILSNQDIELYEMAGRLSREGMYRICLALVGEI